MGVLKMILVLAYKYVKQINPEVGRYCNEIKYLFISLIKTNHQHTDLRLFAWNINILSQQQNG